MFRRVREGLDWGEIFGRSCLRRRKMLGGISISFLRRISY